MRQIIENYQADAIRSFRNYKKLAERAIDQVSDDEFFATIDEEANSIALLVKHIAGNLRSRWTDFLTTDGEKPWRHRDDEFEMASLNRADLMASWEGAWVTVLDEVSKLTDADLGKTVTVRRQPLRIDEALHRSLAHTAYHVGQIVYLAKEMRGDGWRTLSIPKGKSEEYNRQATRETAAAHAEMLKRR